MFGTSKRSSPIQVAQTTIGSLPAPIPPPQSSGGGGSSIDYSALKIAPPPEGGVYLGQYEWKAGDIANLELIVGRPLALWSQYQPGSWVTEHDPTGHPHFDLSAARSAWANGKVSLVTAYNLYPHPNERENPDGFTVDALLRGEYDVHLARLADEFRSFGRPLFFTASREPNGVGSDYFGGFGEDGSKSTAWAVSNLQGLAEFDPSGFPNSGLYAGLGSPNVCDGIERLAAGQRYYHDFFVRRSGLDFLTFDTMGWAALAPHQIQTEINEHAAAGNPIHAANLLTNCHAFENFYPGSDYVDWVSITYYMLDYSASEQPGLNIDLSHTISEHLGFFRSAYDDISTVASGKPIFVMELGLPDTVHPSSARAAQKVQQFFAGLVAEFTNVHAIALWGNHSNWYDENTSTGWFPWDTLIRPGTMQGDALRAVIDTHPTHFHSCVYFSDGSKIPTCR